MATFVLVHGAYQGGWIWKPVVERLNSEINRILMRPEIAESWRRQGANTMVMSPEEFGAYIESEIARWGKLIKEAHIQIE